MALATTFLSVSQQVAVFGEDTAPYSDLRLWVSDKSCDGGFPPKEEVRTVISGFAAQRDEKLAASYPALVKLHMNLDWPRANVPL